MPSWLPEDIERETGALHGYNVAGYWAPSSVKRRREQQKFEEDKERTRQLLAKWQREKAAQPVVAPPPDAIAPSREVEPPFSIDPVMEQSPDLMIDPTRDTQSPDMMQPALDTSGAENLNIGDFQNPAVQDYWRRKGVMNVGQPLLDPTPLAGPDIRREMMEKGIAFAGPGEGPISMETIDTMEQRPMPTPPAPLTKADRMADALEFWDVDPRERDINDETLTQKQKAWLWQKKKDFMDAYRRKDWKSYNNLADYTRDLMKLKDKHGELASNVLILDFIRKQVGPQGTFTPPKLKEQYKRWDNTRTQKDEVEMLNADAEAKNSQRRWTVDPYGTRPRQIDIVETPEEKEERAAQMREQRQTELFKSGHLKKDEWRTSMDQAGRPTWERIEKSAEAKTESETVKEYRKKLEDHQNIVDYVAEGGKVKRVPGGYKPWTTKDEEAGIQAIKSVKDLVPPKPLREAAARPMPDDIAKAKQHVATLDGPDSPVKAQLIARLAAQPGLEAKLRELAGM